MKAKGLFLDRDGVINREIGRHTTSLAEFEVLPGVPAAIRAANEAGWKVVVITNQSGIQLGLYDHTELGRMHDRLRETLRSVGTHVSDILYCPHHPSKGLCLCRKPGSLLLERGAARQGIDLLRSVMIGDRDRDIEAAAAAGVRGILVEANSELEQTLEQEKLLT